jgi:hypothetical protein
MNLVLAGQTGLTFEGLRKLQVSENPDSVAVRNQLTARAKDLEVVVDQETFEIAAALKKDLKTFADEAEETRKAVKGPVDDLTKRIQTTAKTFIAPVDEELARIQKLMNVYATEQEDRRRKAEAEQARKMRELEAQRQAVQQQLEMQTDAREIAKAQEAQKQILAQQSAALCVAEPPKLAGVQNRTDFEFDVDIDELWDKRPELCNPPTPKMIEIKKLLREGNTIAGIKNVRKVAKIV